MSLSWRVVVSAPEAKLFATLLQSTTYPSATRTVQEPTVLRVAGGWVRDKLLGRESHDIDIAINNQSGVDFATTLNEYLKSIGEEVRTLAVIQANPDQSKHLETANVRVLGFEVDCVNLRTETYTDESGRIPTMCHGTAQEDALRRDFTINALFYNLNTGAVEDLTGMGLADLAKGVVRTPIDPNVTFKDDPLRVLRALRFASRFNFSLDSDLAQAASSPEVKAALIAKVRNQTRQKIVDKQSRDK
jgi:tRNA nucleotidyltransferase/poly(A) polymerase